MPRRRVHDELTCSDTRWLINRLIIQREVLYSRREGVRLDAESDGQNATDTSESVEVPRPRQGKIVAAQAEP